MLINGLEPWKQKPCTLVTGSNSHVRHKIRGKGLKVAKVRWWFYIILIIIDSKYFPDSDWLKAHVQFTITSY